MLKVLIAHAYSTMNRGDGLLVDLSRDVIRDAFGNDTKIQVLAIDASSFQNDEVVFQYPPAENGFLSQVAGISRLAASTWLVPSVDGLARSDFERPDLIIGVGGGYLRSDGGIRSLKSLIAHGLQMRWLFSLGVPMFYLPQSVGPLTDIEGRIIKRWASKLDRLNVRDDRSIKIFGSNSAHIRRRPDLAVSSIARQLKTPVYLHEAPTDKPRLIARHLQRNSGITLAYESKLRLLIEKIPDLTPALQSSGRGNDDPSFYVKMGWGGNIPFLRDLVAQERKPQFVISVRLHGALESIIAGIPAIHLSYERKGFGAYDDLGVSEFVHNANSFDAELVVEQARMIVENPQIYWSKVEQRLPGISSEYSEMICDLRDVIKVKSL
jgi:polysaccharide pyruvyl transferase WcaK-like protein